MFLAVESMSVKACSAVEIVLPVGVFITITPWSVDASRSMLSTPTPALPITLSLVAASRNLEGRSGNAALEIQYIYQPLPNPSLPSDLFIVLSKQVYVSTVVGHQN